MHILVLYDEFCPLGISLRRFHCIDELWYALGISEERFHKLCDVDCINCMKAQTNFSVMVKDSEGRDVSIKRIRLL